VLCTHFEATFARLAFPCFDEPQKRATFQLNVLVPEDNMIAISNTPVDKIEKTDKGSLYRFLITPYMSTYLLSWVIGKFEYLEGISKTGVNIRVYTPVGRKMEAKDPLELSLKCVDFFTDYFAITYPLKKLDLISLHGNIKFSCIDMEVRAMENWGCITFADYALLPEATTSLNLTHRSARTICHEISHMWFGNLVTMKWWTYLWLNEGFARYMEHIAIEEIRPNYKIWEKFYPQIQVEAFNADTIPHTHPVEIECKATNEIDKIFDTISYSKGASLVKMLNDFIGEEDFKKAIRLYLRQHLYSNTVSNDLWKAFDEVTGKPITEMMNKWIQIPGYVLFIHLGILWLR